MHWRKQLPQPKDSFDETPKGLIEASDIRYTTEGSYEVDRINNTARPVLRGCDECYTNLYKATDNTLWGLSEAGTWRKIGGKRPTRLPISEYTGQEYDPDWGVSDPMGSRPRVKRW